jgi:hypothetical protein
MTEQRRRGYDQELIIRGAHLAPRVEEEPPFCWYCPTNAGQHSKEHVFARWLLKELRAKDLILEPQHHSPMGDVISKRGPLTANNLLAGEVCAACNSGWMSALELAVRPVLFPEGGRGQLSIDGQATLARWFVKTAIALNISQNYRLMVPRDARHALRTAIPKAFKVFLARYAGSEVLNWIQGTNLAMFTPCLVSEDGSGVEMPSAMREAYSVGIAVGNVLGIVTYAPPNGWIRPHREETPRIWPPVNELEWAALPEYRHMFEASFLTGDVPEESPPAPSGESPEVTNFRPPDSPHDVG